MNLQDTKAFLNALAGGAGAGIDGTFAFQTFDDSEQKRRDLARVEIGPAALVESLAFQRLNDAGAGMFVTINRTDAAGRKASNVTAIRALFVDADDVPFPQSWHVLPSIVVKRDDTHWHAYWLFSDAERQRTAGLTLESRAAEFKDAQKRLAAYYGTDAAVCDLPRVMRLPGFLHRKGAPILVALLDCHPERVYTRAEVLAVVPALETAQPAAPVAPAKPASQDRAFVIERARKYMRSVDPAIAGQHGHNQAYHAAGVLIHGFALSLDEARPLFSEWNQGCQPPWTEVELEHKLASVLKKTGNRGYLLNQPSRNSSAQPSGGRGAENKGSKGLPESTEFETEVELDGGAVECPASTLPPEAGTDSRAAVENSDDAREATVQTPSDTTAASAREEQRKKAEEWLNKDFEKELYAASALSGTDQDAAVLALFAHIADALDGLTTITKARVRKTVTDELKLTKADYEQAIREERARKRSRGGDAFDWSSLARQFMADMGADKALKRWRERWYLWQRDEGAYAVKSDEWMDAQATAWLAAQGVMVTTNAVGNFLKNLKGAVYLDDDILPPRWLCKCDGERIREDGIYAALRNGIVDLEHPERTLLKHTPHYWTLNALPYDYDPQATCPQFMEAVLQWQPPVDGNPLGAQLLRDWAAYCLIPGNPEQVFLLCVGDGRDGKSQYAEILTALCGEKNTEAVGLEAFDPRNEFGREPLLGKTLNITGDANQIEQMGEGLLKAIVGGDRVSVNRKNKSIITERLMCKFVINANSLPFFRDRSEGLWRRMLLLNWQQVPTEKVVKDYAKKLIREEISGIFNWVVGAIPGVRQNGFNRGDYLAVAVEHAREEIQHEIKFFEERVDFFPREFDNAEPVIKTYVKEFIEAYRDWSNENNVKAVLYEENLAKALRKWLKRKLLLGAWQDGEPVSEQRVNEMLKGLRRRDGEGRRRMYYRGVALSTDAARELPGMLAS